ncbi:MAG: adenosylcobinamide kinase [Geobacteraceae bacterium]|nr:adenosylcobinamide kinase [Geobacteraceae bacterium]
MAKILFITGGARSGKSRLAESLAEGFGTPLCYIATGQALDTEMEERISAHRTRRGGNWHTVEEPLRLAETIRNVDGSFQAILVDCITLWLTNLLLTNEDTDKVMAKVGALVEVMPKGKTPLILVSNEVGMGIVPENALARKFRDLAGKANQMLASAADEAYVTFSGIPIRLK